MNRLLAGSLAILAMCSTANAATLVEQRCARAADTAAAIAENHQRAIPLASVLEVMDQNVPAGPDRDGAKSLVLMIYGQPRYQTPEMQQRFVAKWRDDVHMLCLAGAKAARAYERPA